MKFIKTKDPKHTRVNLNKVEYYGPANYNSTFYINFTLPNPSSCYDGANLASIVYNVSKIDISANTVTILPYATETIGGNVSLVLAAQNEAIELVTDGTNWYIKG